MKPRLGLYKAYKEERRGEWPCSSIYSLLLYVSKVCV